MLRALREGASQVRRNGHACQFVTPSLAIPETLADELRYLPMMLLEHAQNMELLISRYTRISDYASEYRDESFLTSIEVKLHLLFFGTTLHRHTS